MSNKTELQSNNVDLQAILNKANALPDKVVLPTLSNPASAEHILGGYEAIDSLGTLITGTMSPVSLQVQVVTTSVNNQRTLTNIPSTFYLVYYGVSNTQIFYKCTNGSLSSIKYVNTDSSSVRVTEPSYSKSSGKLVLPYDQNGTTITCYVIYVG